MQRPSRRALQTNGASDDDRMARGESGRGCVSLMLIIARHRGPRRDPAHRFHRGARRQRLDNPTAMQFAPDGRLFVCEQGGRLRVIKNGALLARRSSRVTVNSAGERGLLGVAFDPNFAVNQFVYVYYTATTPGRSQPLSRFTANGDVAVAGSEVVLLELDNLSSATNHNGGALALRPRRQALRRGRRERQRRQRADAREPARQDAAHQHATAPSPPTTRSSASATGQEPRDLGARPAQPVHLRLQPGAAAMFINDVGQNTWEEINDGLAGANYGWPDTEGADDRSALRSARATPTAHAGGACAITGGAFYAPLNAQFPSDYLNDYFFADYCGGWIRRLDPATGNAVTTFATGIASPVDLKVADDGSLYYLARGSGGTTGVVVSRRLRRDRADDHDAAGEPDRRAGRVGHLQRARVGPGAAALSVAAQRRQHRGRDRAGLHDRLGRRRPTTARASAPSSRNDFGSATSAEAVLTVTVEPGARRRRSRSRPPARSTAAGCVDQLRGHRHRSRGRHAAGERLHLAGRLPPRHAHASVHRRRRSGATERVVHHPDHGRDGGQRLVPHLPDRPRLRRPHAHDAARRPAAQGPR